MIRVLKTEFYATKTTIDKLFELNRWSGEVWNNCLEIAKEHHLQTGKWINKTLLKQRTKKIQPLHSQSMYMETLGRQESTLNNKRIYGLRKHEVVDGLSRPCIVRCCCLFYLQDEQGFFVKLWHPTIPPLVILQG